MNFKWLGRYGPYVMFREVLRDGTDRWTISNVAFPSGPIYHFDNGGDAIAEWNNLAAAYDDALIWIDKYVSI